jgi:hypothetical protein
MLLDAIREMSKKHPPEAPCFNPLTILRNAHDEVGLHSRFIAALLDPGEAHGCGCRSLELFLSAVGVEGFDMRGCVVKREKEHIDILVTNRCGQAVIIENKIYAADRNRQIEGYVERIREMKLSVLAVVYLTLDGREPSSESVGGCRALVRLASYKDDILEWLQGCAACTNDDHVQGAIEYYRRAVRELSGRTASRECVMEAAKLLLESDNLKVAMTIVEAIEEAKVLIQLRFWQALEEKLQQDGLRKLPHQHYSEEKVKDYYGTKRGRCWYGLMFDLPQSVLDDGVGLALFVEAGKNEGVVFGLTLVAEDGNRNLDQRADYAWLRKVVEEIGGFRCDHPAWLGYRPVEPPIDFISFSGDRMLTLGNEQAREKVVAAVVEDILGALASFKYECGRTEHPRAGRLADDLPSL